MLAYQMVGLADQNGRTYESEYGTYNKEDGFRLKRNYIDGLDKNPYKSANAVANMLLHEDCWSLRNEAKKVTKKQLEDALGFRIEIVENEKDSDYATGADLICRQDEFIDILRDLFG